MHAMAHPGDGGRAAEANQVTQDIQEGAKGRPPPGAPSHTCQAWAGHRSISIQAITTISIDDDAR